MLDPGRAEMKVGGKARLTCPAATAYGARGVPGVIPPDTELTFEIELLGHPALSSDIWVSQIQQGPQRCGPFSSLCVIRKWPKTRLYGKSSEAAHRSLPIGNL